MKRRDFLKTTGALAATAAMGTWTKALAEATLGNSGGKPLNFLFITADDMNATMPGWMGNPHKPTPQMDAFAATCHRFVNNRAAAPICQPSREAMMTGLVPHHSGAFGFNPIRDGIPTLVTILKSHGYYTAALNKLTHMAPPTSFPWDSTYDNCGKSPVGIENNMTAALKAAKDSGKPFFINCNITDPHRRFYGAGPNGKPAEGGAPQNLPHEFTPDQITVPTFLPDIADVRKEVCQYYNSVQRLDVSFGNILAALKDAGQEDQTLVLFVSDHGMPFPFSKATLYNHGPWVPAIMRWPGMGTPQVHDEFTGSIDIFPTVLEILGLPAPPNIDGRSWMPLLAGQKQPDRDFAISHVSSLSSGKYFPQRLVQTKNRALMFAPWADGTLNFHAESMQGLTYNAMVAAAKTDPAIQARVNQYLYGIPLAFYDLEKDPDQRVNLIADPKYRDEVDRHKNILLAYMERTKDPEYENFKTVLAGGTPDIKSTGKPIRQEEEQLQKKSRAQGGGENS